MLIFTLSILFKIRVQSLSRLMKFSYPIIVAGFLLFHKSKFAFLHAQVVKSKLKLLEALLDKRERAKKAGAPPNGL